MSKTRFFATDGARLRGSRRADGSVCTQSHAPDGLRNPFGTQAQIARRFYFPHRCRHATAKAAPPGLQPTRLPPPTPPPERPARWRWPGAHAAQATHHRPHKPRRRPPHKLAETGPGGKKTAQRPGSEAGAQGPPDGTEAEGAKEAAELQHLPAPQGPGRPDTKHAPQQAGGGAAAAPGPATDAQRKARRRPGRTGRRRTPRARLRRRPKPPRAHGTHAHEPQPGHPLRPRPRP